MPPAPHPLPTLSGVGARGARSVAGAKRGAEPGVWGAQWGQQGHPAPAWAKVLSLQRCTCGLPVPPTCPCAPAPVAPGDRIGEGGGAQAGCLQSRWLRAERQGCLPAITPTFPPTATLEPGPPLLQDVRWHVQKPAQVPGAGGGGGGGPAPEGSSAGHQASLRAHQRAACSGGGRGN